MFHGLFIIGKALLLLAVSFFILLVVPKAKPKNVQTFGNLLAGALCVLAGLMVVLAVYACATGKPLKLRKYMMHKKACPTETMPAKPMNRGIIRSK